MCVYCCCCPTLCCSYISLLLLYCLCRLLSNVDEHIPIEEVASTGVKSCPLQPLPFRKEDLEGFRYRVEDVMRAVTQVGTVAGGACGAVWCDTMCCGVVLCDVMRWHAMRCVRCAK